MKFLCIHCGQSLEIDDDQGGRTIQCPSCGRYIAVPVPVSAFQKTTGNPPALSTIDTTRATNSPQAVKVSEVRVVNIDMPFMSMVKFMIKWAIAAIPAMLVLGFIYLLFATLLMEGCAAAIMNMN